MFSIPKTPRTLWIELTSKCPFDCVFCSRKFRRGAGEHLPFPLYESLVASLDAPRRLLLNYSGESIHYPHLIPAIRLARKSGAFVELVSAFSSIRPDQLEPLASSGLGRLTISLHAAESNAYADIYRFGSFEALRSRLERFLDLCQSIVRPPAVDLSFVAMRRNLNQLRPVAELARRLNIPSISVFPVLRRDEIPELFPAEWIRGADGGWTDQFRRELATAVEEASRSQPEVAIQLTTPAFSRATPCLGEVPVSFAGPLPVGARIHSCEQNPWETAHVLANGDVVVCESLDGTPMGNLQEQSIEEIWRGEPYRAFRERYPKGATAECIRCPWKAAYVPGPLKSAILARDGGSAQLIHGWHPPAPENALWSTQHAAAMLQPRSGAASLHVAGLLPPGPDGLPNELTVSVNGDFVGRAANWNREPMAVDLDSPVPAGDGAPWQIELRTAHVYRPSEHGENPDTRDLGFALTALSSQRSRPQHPLWMRGSARFLAGAVRVLDHLAHTRRLHTAPDSLHNPPPSPGVSVIVPERDHLAVLAPCLESAREAIARVDEPHEVIVVVNGADPLQYRALAARHPRVRWLFSQGPLGFSAAVHMGLRAARYHWVYLLNSDVVLEPTALSQLLPYREPDVFSIGSQIMLTDATVFREETNFTALVDENGLWTAHDRLPPAQPVAECAYSGGGASLFQQQLLAPFVRDSAPYDPFYWEDVEWGWRARRLGYRVLFASESIARHQRRATIGRHYTADQVDAILERNRVLFHLRNRTEPGSRASLRRALSELQPDAVRHLLTPQVLWGSLRARWWSHAVSRAAAHR